MPEPYYISKMTEGNSNSCSQYKNISYVILHRKHLLLTLTANKILYFTVYRHRSWKLKILCTGKKEKAKQSCN